MTVTDTVEGTRGTAPGSATATQDAPRRLARSPHVLAADLFDIARPHLTRDELATLAGRSEEVRVQLDSLVALGTLLAVAGDTLEESALREAIFVLTNGIEAASASLFVANEAAAELRSAVQ